MNARLPAVLLLLSGCAQPLGRTEIPLPEPVSLLVRDSVRGLVEMQEKDGAWPYEGVYRVEREIPAGYRVGGTAIVSGTLLHGAPHDPDARRAVARGLAFVLHGLEDPRLQPSTENAYDVRVWAHVHALEFLCHLREAGAAGDRAADVDAWIPRLVAILAEEEIPGGGWNYAGRRRPASFVTAPAAQALLLARGQGFPVSDDLLGRARTVLEAARGGGGAFLYNGIFGPGQERVTGDALAGSSARSAGCETTLRLLGGGTEAAIRGALEAFHVHWADLEVRRRRTGTHEGPHAIAPYYFFYGHRYAAQAIQMLPAAARAGERRRLLELILRTRDADGTWNDRVFERSRNYGTAMILLALLGDRVPLPPCHVSATQKSDTR